MISATRYFLRYAFSCAQVLRESGEMTQQEYDKVADAAMDDKELPLPELERLFPAAFRRLRSIAEREGKPTYDEQAVKEYFPRDHNGFIDAGDGTYGEAPAWFCELCKVKRLEVLRTKVVDDKLFLRVEQNRWVQSPFFNAITGDIVVVHHHYAVELVE
ncbi:hypothetical protein GF367_00940 [Candidatus Woesearchaeota archaeon]|nr:hypothetical protein [Candidatus Woesearchaeota archaeon]